MKNLAKLIPNSVSRQIARQALVVQKNSPTILFVGGVAGVVTTTVLACKATLKLNDVLDKTKSDIGDAKRLHEEHASGTRENYPEESYKHDMAFLYIRTAMNVTKLYGPAVLVGIASVGALTGSHNILSRRNAGLTAAYAAVEKSFREYRDRVVAEHGEDKDREYRYGSEKRTIVEEQPSGQMKKIEVTRVGGREYSGYERFFDEYTKNWKPTPEYNFLFIKCQQNWANDILQSRGHLFLNEVYDMLGIERSKAGQVVGWVIGDEGDNFVDFGVFDGDNPRARDFVNGREGSILLDFNVDGVIYDKI